jgi:hypothetical protein
MYAWWHLAKFRVMPPSRRATAIVVPGRYTPGEATTPCGQIDREWWYGRPLEVVVEQAHHAGQAPDRRLLLLRLLLLLLGGVLFVLLSSGPARAAERQRSGLLDPVGGTLAAATEPVGSLARGAAGTVSSTVGRTAGAARRSVASPRRPAARQAVGSTAPAPVAGALKRGAAAITSPVRRTAPPTRGITRPLRRAAASPTNVLAGSVRPAVTAVAGRLGGAVAPVAGAAAPAGHVVAPVAGAVGPLAGPLAGALAPIGGAAGPVAGALGGALAPVTGPVGALDPVLGPLGRRAGGLLPGGLLPVELPLPGGPPTSRPAPMTSRAGPVADLLTSPASAGPAPIFPPSVAGQPPATGDAAHHHPASPAPQVASRVPAPAQLPAGRDAVSDSSATGAGLAALAGALLPFGLRRHARVGAERSGIRSRSYLPLVAPA